MFFTFVFFGTFIIKRQTININKFCGFFVIVFVGVIACDLSIPTDIAVVIDQRCTDNQAIRDRCEDRRSLVYNVFNSVFEASLTQMALITLECTNPMGHIDFISSLNNNKTALLNYIKDENQFDMCMANQFPTMDCVNSCGVGLDTALNCFENNASPNNRKVLVFISFCECEGQGTDSICNRQTELEELGIEVIVANVDVSSDNAICVDSDESTITSQNGITDSLEQQIISNICRDVTPSPTEEQKTTTTGTQTTEEEITTTTLSEVSPSPSLAPSTPSPTYGLSFFLTLINDYVL